MSNKTIFLKNEILENNEMSDYDIAVYVSLTNVYGNSKDEVLINVDTILYDLYEKAFSKLTRKVKDKFKESIEHLSELGVIGIVENCERGVYIIDTNGLFFISNAENPFTIVEKEDVRKILSLECKEDKLKLLRYFIMLMRTVNGKDHVGFMSIDHLAKLANVARRSVFTYNNLLEENEIIYVYHHDMIYSIGNDAISSLPNHYGRYADKNKIEAYALGYEDDKKQEISDIKRKKKKTKENQSNAQDTRYGNTSSTKKESTKVETNDYDFDEDDVEF